ncbi:hypothetical protein GOBAR_AA00196 [Gossypium barbadense]|uniref:DNA-directed RNA polymerase insert domain-containing protein n=1 Tax=Gossypium barbadense TaxID=3634 RepID=A0A2P5YXQ1_GOSBA|nr:hypothetical protein GOBAR_AA00196 [Gossypium barbadense]
MEKLARQPVYDHLVHVGMGAVVHGKVHVEYQKELFMFKQVSKQYHCYCYRCTGSGNLLVLYRHLWIQEKVKVSTSTRTRQWKCVESRTDSKRLYYGCFILSPLMKGQADTIGIAMRRALLGELEGTCITCAKSEKIPHEYSTIVEIVLRGNLYGTRNAFICAKGPGYVTAQDIILPPSVEIVDNTQHVASLTEPIDLCIGLQIERNRGYGIKMPKNFHDGS